jgi:hypothetical protein
MKSLVYYITRVFQRLALCAVIGATVIHWIILISTTSSLQYISQLEAHRYKDSQALNAELTKIINMQSLVALRWFIFSMLITSLLLFIKRFRKYEKPLIVDSITVTVFCFVSVMLSQTIIRAFLTRV